jgi:hypothetical protein
MPKIIFATTFTGKTPWGGTGTKSIEAEGKGGGFKGQTWYDNRYKLYREFTLKSLMNQTDKDFLIWLQFRPEEKDNPTTAKIESQLKLSGLKYIMTFDSPIMMEDRAPWHNVDLIERATRSLKQLEPIEEDYVVEVNLDSDDMVHKRFVEILKTKETKDRKAFFMRKGFMYSVDNRLADWNNPYSMSIYAIVYPTPIFLDAQKHFDYQNGLNSHEQIPKLFDAEELPDGMYCCLYHGFNISTIWGHDYMGKEYYYEDEKEIILKDFKTND